MHSIRAPGLRAGILRIPPVIERFPRVIGLTFRSYIQLTLCFYVVEGGGGRRRSERIELEEGQMKKNTTCV